MVGKFVSPAKSFVAKKIQSSLHSKERQTWYVYITATAFLFDALGIFILECGQRLGVENK